MPRPRPPLSAASPRRPPRRRSPRRRPARRRASSSRGSSSPAASASRPSPSAASAPLLLVAGPSRPLVAGRLNAAPPSHGALSVSGHLFASRHIAAPPRHRPPRRRVSSVAGHLFPAPADAHKRKLKKLGDCVLTSASPLCVCEMGVK